MYMRSAYFGMLFSVFIPPGYPVQIYIHVRDILQGPIVRFKQSCRMTDRRSIAPGTASRLGYRGSRNEGSSCCTFSACHRVNVAKNRQ